MANNDKSWWNNFYKRGEAPSGCSTFAASVLSRISKDEPLFELGCGNGRDAIFFAEKHIRVVASDLSEATIEILKEKFNGSPNLRFVNADFTNLPTPLEDGALFGTVYSRFTLHSVKKEGASRALQWAFNNLKSGGLLLIEVRSVLDPMCGKGTKVEGEKDAWINTHYRRFHRKDELCEELEQLGFKLESVVEADNLAVYKDDNPVVIRIEAKKV